MRECFLNELPKYKNGRYKNKIEWQKSNNCKIKFIYDNIQGEFLILNYNKSNHILEIKYDEEIYKIASYCSRISEKEFGVFLIDVGIRGCCNNKQKQTKGYKFKYISDLTSEEYIKYDIENKLV